MTPMTENCDSGTLHFQLDRVPWRQNFPSLWAIDHWKALVMHALSRSQQPKMARDILRPSFSRKREQSSQITLRRANPRLSLAQTAKTERIWGSQYSTPHATAQTIIECLKGIYCSTLLFADELPIVKRHHLCTTNSPPASLSQPQTKWAPEQFPNGSKKAFIRVRLSSPFTQVQDRLEWWKTNVVSRNRAGTSSVTQNY